MKQLAFVFVMVLISASVSATLMLDNIQFDPAIIAAGDEVDIVIQFHHEPTPEEQDIIGNKEYTFQVRLEPDDAVTRDYVVVMDDEGDDLTGRIVGEGYFNRKFRIKVMQDAIPGNYEFRLIGQWYRNGVPEAYYQDVTFTIPVKKEGISLSVSNIISVPEKIRSGDKNILLKATVYNTGEKTAKNVRIRLTYPEGLSSSYTNDNQLYIGSIEPMQERLVQFYVDTDRFIKEDDYRIFYMLDYEDIDSNDYEAEGSFPFVVKKKPNIVVTGSEGTGLAGERIELRVTVQNQGEETADAVDLRMLKQSSQPFEIDVRSSYLGEMKPGENATAVFIMDANRDAEQKEHAFNVMIRARGDSEEGDNNIYTYTGSAKLDITGMKKNNYPLIGGLVLAAVLVIAVIASMMRKRR